MTFQTFRKWTSSKQNERIKYLLSRFDKFQREENSIEDDTFKALGFTSRSRMSYHDELAFTRLSNNTELDNKTCIEPDGLNLTLWLTFDGLTYLEDRSLFGHIGTIYGAATCGALSEGLNEGFGAGGNMCLNFDGIDNYVKVASSNYINLTGNSVGFSIFLRFKPTNSSDDTVLFEKTDDTNNLYAYKAILHDGEILFVVSENGTITRVGTGQVISDDNWYDCWFTYAVSTNTAKIYVNNSVYTTAPTSAGFSGQGYSGEGYMTQSENTNFGSFLTSGTSLIIGTNINLNSFFEGYIQDFRFWNEKIVNATEIDNMWENKLTISNIEFGNTSVVGYGMIGGAKKRSVTESVSISDSITALKILSHPVMKSVSEPSISVSDNATYLMNPTVPRVVYESTNISDSVTVTKGSLLVKVGNITKSTSTTGLPKTVSYSTEIGFTPKFMMFWGTYNSSYGSFTDYDRYFIGFSDGTNNRSAASSDLDDSGTTQSSHGAYTSAISYIDDDNHEECLATCTFTTSGFNLTYTENNNASYIINYIAFGGSVLTNVKVGDFTGPSTSTGTYPVTGIGFKPDLNLFIPTDLTALNTNDNHGILNFGVGQKVTRMVLGIPIDYIEQFAFGSTDDHSNSTSDTYSITKNDRMLEILHHGDPDVDKAAEFISNDSNGFTLNYDIALESAYKCIYASLKGITCKVDKFTTTYGTGLQTISGVGFKPRMIIFVGHGRTRQSSDYAAVEDKLCIGCVTDNMNRRSATKHIKAGEGTTVNANRSQSNKCYQIFTAASSASSSSITFEMDINSFNTDGFTINKNIHSGLNHDIFFIAIK